MSTNEENKKPTQGEEEDNVFLFVPNLIGYGRIFLQIIAMWFMPSNHVVAAWCYILSGLVRTFLISRPVDPPLKGSLHLSWMLLTATPRAPSIRGPSSGPCWIN